MNRTFVYGNISSEITKPGLILYESLNYPDYLKGVYFNKGPGRDLLLIRFQHCLMAEKKPEENLTQ